MPPNLFLEFGAAVLRVCREQSIRIGFGRYRSKVRHQEKDGLIGIVCMREDGCGLTWSVHDSFLEGRSPNELMLIAEFGIRYLNRLAHREVMFGLN